MAHRPKIDNSVEVRSKQNLSCNWIGSTDFGRLTPFHWEELLQGDHVITCKPRVEMQMLPLASPTFGKIDLYCHYFVVPIRQLQKDFYSIWSQTGIDKNHSFLHLTPKKMSTIFDAYDAGSQSRFRAIYKHWSSLGLPPFFINSSDDDTTPISLWPFLAYNKIWWDFYRDPEVLRDESVDDYIFNGGQRDIVPDASFVRKFLSPHVRSIKNNWISDLFASPGDFIQNNPLMDGSLPYQRGDIYGRVNGDAYDSYLDEGSGEGLGFAITPDGSPSPTDNTSRMLRIIESLTRLSERLSLSGKREIEALFARYGIKPKWSEMNLCRYVGGAKSTVLVDNIISTADTGDNGLPLGAQAGKGYCALNDLNIEVSVDEPSILMGVLSVMPHIHFVQGLSKKWQRKDLQDMFQSSLQYVGQVAVAKREVGKQYGFVQYDEAEDADTFAFADPYYEYKMGLDVLAGDFLFYHQTNVADPTQTTKYMQSMEQYIDYPVDREFSLDNLLVDGAQYNRIFNYLGGSVNDDVDDHFHICVDKEVVIDRPMEGYPIPTLETTQQPHSKTTQLGKDTIL